MAALLCAWLNGYVMVWLCLSMCFTVRAPPHLRYSQAGQ